MKKLIRLFTYSFIIVSVYFSNSCETIDDLQFDNLGLRGQIDSLMTRVTLLTEEIVEQKNLTKTFTPSSYWKSKIEQQTTLKIKQSN